MYFSHYFIERKSVYIKTSMIKKGPHSHRRCSLLKTTKVPKIIIINSNTNFYRSLVTIILFFQYISMTQILPEKNKTFTLDWVPRRVWKLGNGPFVIKGCCTLHRLNLATCWLKFDRVKHTDYAWSTFLNIQELCVCSHRIYICCS